MIGVLFHCVKEDINVNSYHHIKASFVDIIENVEWSCQICQKVTIIDKWVDLFSLYCFVDFIH